MRRTLLLLLLVPLLVLPVGPGPTAYAADEECGLEPATIVGDGGTTLEGTPERDVILTNGSQYVYAGAGSDLVCITGGTIFVDAGDGDDTVLVEAPQASATVCLGDGADSYLGGPGDDRVLAQPLFCADSEGYEPSEAGNPDDVVPTPGEERPDDIRTFGGDDVVQTGTGEVTADYVDLGEGSDDLVLGALRMTPGRTIMGGLGIDTFEHRPIFGAPSPTLSAPYSLRNDRPAAGRATSAGRKVLGWSSMERFVLLGAVRAYDVVGSGSSQYVRVARARSIDLRGGDDVLDVLSTVRPTTLLGGTGDDELRTIGCIGTIDGQAGNDLVSAFRTTGRPCGSTTFRTVRGGKGNDRLVGRVRDRLDGGLGRDGCQGGRQARCER